MRQTLAQHRGRRALASILAFVCGLVLAQGLSAEARADEDDPLTVPELLVPKRGQDLSAYRFDSDVFGWNKTFTEMAALASEVTRGPQGRQRGEVFMLVYPVGHAVPLHNIQVHVVTHADAVDDPVPIEDVRDMMWTLENPIWLDKWPKRPRRKAFKGAMQVTPIWDPMAVDTTAQSIAGPKGFEAAPLATSDAPCTPGVGFVLHFRGKTRVVPHMAVDLKARCNLIKMTENRIYWGRPDVAADMVRFAFSPRPLNEQSARFAVSAAWHQGEAVRFVASAGHAMDQAARHRISQATRALGPVRFVTQNKKHNKAEATALVAITAAPRFLALARRVAHNLDTQPAAIDIAADDTAGATLTLYFGVPKAMASATPDASLAQHALQPPQTPPAALPTAPPEQMRTPAPSMLSGGIHPVFGTVLPPKLVDSPNPEAASLPPPDKTRDTPVMSAKPKSYLDDWRVP